MDDLNDDPQKIAEDIIKQATKGLGFRQAATDRIIHILNCYQQLQQEMAEPQEQKETETDILYEGEFAWKTTGGEKDGPYCARCHVRDKVLTRLIDLTNGEWECAKCNIYLLDSSYRRPDTNRRAKPRF